MLFSLSDNIIKTIHAEIEPVLLMLRALDVYLRFFFGGGGGGWVGGVGGS